MWAKRVFCLAATAAALAMGASPVDQLSHIAEGLEGLVKKGEAPEGTKDLLLAVQHAKDAASAKGVSAEKEKEILSGAMEKVSAFKNTLAARAKALSKEDHEDTPQGVLAAMETRIEQVQGKLQAMLTRPSPPEGAAKLVADFDAVLKAVRTGNAPAKDKAVMLRNAMGELHDFMRSLDVKMESLKGRHLRRDEREESLLDALIDVQDRTMDLQMGVLSNFMDVPLAQQLKNKHADTTTLAIQVAKLMDDERASDAATKAAPAPPVVFAKGVSVAKQTVLRPLVRQLQTREMGLISAVKELEDDEAAREKLFANVKTGQALIKEERHRLRKQVAGKKKELHGIKSAIKAIESGDIAAVQNVLATLSKGTASVKETAETVATAPAPAPVAPQAPATPVAHAEKKESKKLKGMTQHKCRVMCQRFGMKSLGSEFEQLGPTECMTKCNQVYTN